MKKNHHLAWIWRVWRERKGLIALLFVLTLTSSAVAVAYPYLSKVLIDMMRMSGSLKIHLPSTTFC